LGLCEHRHEATGFVKDLLVL